MRGAIKSLHRRTHYFTSDSLNEGESAFKHERIATRKQGMRTRLRLDYQVGILEADQSFNRLRAA